jgi:hypothetical protein
MRSLKVFRQYLLGTMAISALDRIACERNDISSGLSSNARHVPLSSNAKGTDLPLYDFDNYLDTIGIDKQGVFHYYSKEAENTAILQDLLVDGRNLVSRLYSYRSCINGLPSISSPTTPEGKEQLARQIHDVLRPEIAKMFDFMKFRDHAVKTVKTVVANVLSERVGELFPSTEFLSSLAFIFDLFIVFPIFDLNLSRFWIL